MSARTIALTILSLLALELRTSAQPIVVQGGAGGGQMRVTMGTGGSIQNRQQTLSAIKEQFDPKSTLNPGRFVGGI